MLKNVKGFKNDFTFCIFLLSTYILRCKFRKNMHAKLFIYSLHIPSRTLYDKIGIQFEQKTHFLFCSTWDSLTTATAKAPLINKHFCLTTYSRSKVSHRQVSDIFQIKIHG